jgi:lipopolysaccharide biosynthesis glycosyltransferase
MNLIYACVFHKESYINLLKLLITSIYVKGNIKHTDILIITSPSFQQSIEWALQCFDLPLHYYLLDLHTLFDAACARLNIFKYENIHKYDTILYLDTDILINSDINTLFNLDISPEKIYVLEEGNIGYDFWGSQFFDFTKFDRNITAFTSGVILFKNSECIKLLFDTIQLHILDHVYDKKGPITGCLEQPFIVYNAISQNKYDNQVLKNYVENSPSIASDKIVYHFPGDPGLYNSKLLKMEAFWLSILELSE